MRIYDLTNGFTREPNKGRVYDMTGCNEFPLLSELYGELFMMEVKGNA